MSVLGEKDSASVKQLDSGIQCSWNWSWLKLKGKITVKGEEVSFNLEDVFRKISKQGFARCILCQKDYAKKGSHALQAHCQTEVHKKKVQVIASTHSVDSTFLPSRETASTSQGPACRRPEIIRQQCQAKIPVPTVNRIANAEVGVGLLVSTGNIGIEYTTSAGHWQHHHLNMEYTSFTLIT